MRTLAVGDIHGSLNALIQVLERCKYNPGSDQVIFLGDYVDGWSQSADLIDFLIKLNEGSELKHIFIKGNHDKWCEDWLTTGVRHKHWVPQGGQSTIDSYISRGMLVDPKHLKFFRNLHDYYIDEENRGFVHGGFISRKGIGYDVYRSDYYWDRDMWSLAMLLDGNEDQAEGMEKILRFRKHKEVYIGHTATTNWKIKPHYKEYKNDGQKKNGLVTIPMNRCNVWNMDTGCGWKGKLSIMDINTKECWQSDLTSELHPEEEGR